MASQPRPRRFPVAGALIGVGVAVAGAYYGNEYIAAHPAKDPSTALGARPPRAPAPPAKIDFIGAAKMAGTVASLPSGDAGTTADLGPEDAMIVWLKVTQPTAPVGANGAASGGQGGGAAGGRGGGGRGARLPLAVKDSAGRDYAYSMERKDGGMMALHLKKGYDKKPEYLEISEMSAGKSIASWKVTNVPAPTIVVPDDALKGTPMGVIQLRPGGRRGGISAIVHLTMPLAPLEGVILHPVAASYSTIPEDRTNPNGLISKAGETPFDARINLPNAEMARRVSFDAQTYTEVASVETVTFHTARIEDRFGQATFVVDKDEVVATPSGAKVTLAKQDFGPKRAPKRTHPVISVAVSYNGSALPAAPAGIDLTVMPELVSPSLASLGLSKINLEFSAVPREDGSNIAMMSPPASTAGTGGTVKVGPIPALTLRVTLYRPKLGATRRIVLPVDQKVMPAAPGAGGMARG